MITANTPHVHQYPPEQLAQLVDLINTNINKYPERHPLSPEERAMWRAFPAQIRAHRYPFIRTASDLSVAALMKSGFVGPSWTAPHEQMPESSTCK